MAMAGTSADKLSETAGKTSENESGGAACGEWNELAITTLLDNYITKFHEIQRGNLKHKDWEELLAKLTSVCGQGYSYQRCRNKLDSFKKKYKIMKSRRAPGSKAPIKWKYYDRMQKLMDRPAAPGKLNIGGGNKALLPNSDNDMGGMGVSDEDDFDSEGNETESTQTHLNAVVSPAGFAGLAGKHENSTVNEFPLYGLLGRSSAGRMDTFEAGFSLPGASGKPMKKKQKASLRSSPINYVKDVTCMLMDALEKMEKRRLEAEERRMEMMRELELRRNETNLQIAKLIVENTRHFNFQGGTSSEEQQA